jgi:hypothetical protein
MCCRIYDAGTISQDPACPSHPIIALAVDHRMIGESCSRTISCALHTSSGHAFPSLLGEAAAANAIRTGAVISGRASGMPCSNPTSHPCRVVGPAQKAV